MMMNFTLPTRLICAPHCVRDNASCLQDCGKKPLIVTGARSAKLCGAWEDVVAALEGRDYVLYDGICQNPTVQSCYEGAALARDKGCDYVIGIGGGSPLDAAKAIAVLASNPAMDEATLFSNRWEKAPLPVVCIGTTAGTGSEVTPVAVLTTREGRKKSIRHDGIFPVLSLGDYRYTLGLSEEFVMATAVDALCHCAESYFNRGANEISSLFAVRGVAMLAGPLRRMAEDGVKALSEKEREDLYLASLYGGLAISVTGTALCHAMGYFLTEDHQLSHGYACGVYLERFFSLSAKADPCRAQDFVQCVGVSLEELSRWTEALVRAHRPKIGQEEIAALEERWENNKSLKKSLFSLEACQGSDLIRELFS